MRKRIKFIVSVASLALSIAFAMAGVYAAGTARQTAITGTISFTTQNVWGEIAVFEYIGTAPAVFGGSGGSADIDTYLVAERTFLPGTQTVDDITLGTKVGGTGGIIPMDDTKLTYTFIVRITNNGSSALHVQATAPTENEAAVALVPTAGTSPVAATENVTKLYQDWKYVYTITPADVTGAGFTLGISATFNLSNTAFGG